MKISIEKLIELIVREVVKALVNEGVEIDLKDCEEQSSGIAKTQLEIDMSGYKTPVLTENHLDSINDVVKEITVPEKTVITPGARMIIKKKQLVVTHSNNKGE